MTKVLVVDDDEVFAETLVAAFGLHGHSARPAHDHASALRAAGEFRPAWVVLDLKIPGTSGLKLIPELLAVDAALRIVVLTGFAHVATAVEAIKLGARHYLSKPVGLGEILEAFSRDAGDADMPIETASPARLDVVERGHIQAVLDRNGGNISAAARELNMHRRTLQRKLQKRAPSA